MQSTLKKKLNEMEISEERLWDYVYEKLTPIQKGIKEEYEKTEEYRIAQEHHDIVSAYQKAQQAFDELYGKDTYKTCYDVFNTLRDPQQLERLKERKRQSDEYTKRSYQSYSGVHSPKTKTVSGQSRLTIRLSLFSKSIKHGKKSSI